MSVNVRKPWSQLERELADECRRLAELAFHRYCRNLSVPLYLCGSKRKAYTHNETIWLWEKFSVGSCEEIDAREEIFTVQPEALPRHLTVDQLAGAVRKSLSTERLAMFAD